MIEIPTELASQIIGWVAFLIIEGIMVIGMIGGISTRNKAPAYNELSGWSLFTICCGLFITVLFIALWITEEIVFV